MRLFAKLLKGPGVTTRQYPSCFTLSAVPGKRVSKAFGMVKATIAPVYGALNAAEERVASALLEQAQESGANAVINFRFETGSFQKNGHGATPGYLIAYGDAVLLVDDEGQAICLPGANGSSAADIYD